MAKEEDQAIEVTGTVTKVLPATMYKVQQVGPQGVRDFLAIRKAMGLPVDDKAPLYNTRKFNGYTMKRASK